MKFIYIKYKGILLLKKKGEFYCILDQIKRVFIYKCLCVKTGLVQKAKKAKDKLLKREGEDRPDSGSYESFYYGGVDPYMWEPQELGTAFQNCSTANSDFDHFNDFSFL